MLWFLACFLLAISSAVNALTFFPGTEFKITTGRCADCNAPKEGLWYFENEVIAVPKKGEPRLVWVAAPQLFEHVRMNEAGDSVQTLSGVRQLYLVPKIASNRSYFDKSSSAFLSDRMLRMRGNASANSFTARMIWPEDFRIDI